MRKPCGVAEESLQRFHIASVPRNFYCVADGALHSRRRGGEFLRDLRIERFGEGISTHSFRKWYATEIYKNNGYDITLVQRLLQHSSAAITQRYIGIEPERIEKAIEGHTQLI